MFVSMCFEKKVIWLLLVIKLAEDTKAADDDYNILRTDGSFDFGYDNPDSYHYAQANRNNVVRGEFGGRNPKTGAIDTTHYTAGPRGYRPRGKNVVRKYDLSQNGPRAVGSRDDPYYDPYEDPSYSFSFRTRTYNRDENANRVGDVNGRYSYIDDVGERHNVEFIAGKKTGFHVKTPFPDSNPRGYGPLYYRGRGKPIPRGRTSIQRGLDGSYKFVSAGPDQRRTETSDSTGHVRGSYTYLDDKGVQHSVHYIAGPETGYRVLKNVKGPHLPTVFPFRYPDIVPPDFNDIPEIFSTAASGHRKPGFDDEDNGIGDFGGTSSTNRPGGRRPRPPIPTPKYPSDGNEADDEDDTDFDDLFGYTGSRKNKPGISKPKSDEDSFGASKEDSFESPKQTTASKEEDSYKPSTNGLYIPPAGKKLASSDEDYSAGSKPPESSEGFNRRNKFEDSPKDEDFGGLFGSESKARPPSRGGSRPVISIGDAKKSCRKCEGAIVTNVGETELKVPPGVSVRAHVQAIDLLPYSSRFPKPSDQYKAEIGVDTEQLNAEKDEIVRLNDRKGDGNDEEVETEKPTVNKSDESETERAGTKVESSSKKRNEDIDVFGKDDEHANEDDNEATVKTTEIVPTTFSPKKIANKN
ncbi:unnamed protein product [Phyllotreta striolata]|uniref:Uncharacterized protein n=1 Tax=Phyllotreta striolata TaxID=444603 RepID=A0A9N9TJ63_PHYSR|nr:unnamed protein product [Phyllotreta striolata]